MTASSSQFLPGAANPVIMQNSVTCYKVNSLISTVSKASDRLGKRQITGELKHKNLEGKKMRGIERMTNCVIVKHVHVIVQISLIQYLHTAFHFKSALFQ